MLIKSIDNIFYTVCFLTLISLSLIRSYPFFGKLEFILLDGRPWWPSWELLIKDNREEGIATVYTDYITGYILAGVFGKNTVVNVGRHKIPILFIDDMEENKLPGKAFLSLFLTREKGKGSDFSCIINLIGYESSWVPEETHHWQSHLANTSRFYQFKNPSTGSSIFTELERFPPKRCKVYFPVARMSN